jgi:hypothetical protein
VDIEGTGAAEKGSSISGHRRNKYESLEREDSNKI